MVKIDHSSLVKSIKPRWPLLEYMSIDTWVGGNQFPVKITRREVLMLVF